MRLLHAFQSRAGLADRRGWSVRLAHGVHVVLLERTGFGDRLLVDDREVAAPDAFAYEGTLRFPIDGARGELRRTADPVRGVLDAALFVDDRVVEPDPPAPRLAIRVDLGGTLERLAYGAAVALVLAGVSGGELARVAAAAVRTLGVLVLTLGLRAVDPVGLVAAVVEKVASGRVPLIVAGAVIAAVAVLARDRFGSRRLVPPLRSGRRTVRVLGWAAVAALALLVLAVA